MRIVVTDLTRFKNKEILCLAGITEDGKQCIRPLTVANPGYLSYEWCKRMNILPGSILEGTFTKPKNIAAPHVEDRNYTYLQPKGSVGSAKFQSILEKSSTKSVRIGFGCTSQPTDKVLTKPPSKSIITLMIKPTNFRIVHDLYDKEKIKAHLTDYDGFNLRFLGITDLGFFDNVGQTVTRKVSAEEITKFIHKQDILMIRLGLSREYKSPDGRNGYWMQVNGIYTFPNYQEIVRKY